MAKTTAEKLTDSQVYMLLRVLGGGPVHPGPSTGMTAKALVRKGLLQWETVPGSRYMQQVALTKHGRGIANGLRAGR